ncbi:MAG: hypothetical protein K2N48_08295 [Muribaculaceae bacterium]|nr:hypothetical protein [Muribaculaceae bacterium]
MNAPEPFIVGRGTVLKNLLLIPSVGWPIWLVFFTGLVITLAGCFNDVRLLVLGLIICICVTPAVVAFIYFSRTLSPDIVPNLLPHTLERRADGYTLRIWRRPDPEDESESATTWMESGSISLYDSNIIASRSTFDYEMIYFKDSQMKILYVPRF